MKYVYLFLLLIITLPAMANNKVSGEDIVQKATQYSGIRYTPGGSNPKRGFDCSGFVSYVFRKLDISVPRSSVEVIDGKVLVNFGYFDAASNVEDVLYDASNTVKWVSITVD